MSQNDPGLKIDVKRTKEVIKEFISNYNYLYEKRIQKLVFYGDVYCLVNFDQRLTDASFKPYFYGSYSEEISKVLEQLQSEVPTETEVIRGDEVIKFLGNDLDGGDLDASLQLIISRIHQRTRSMSTDELAKFSKQNVLFQETDFGEDMDFNELLKDEIPDEFSDLEEDIPESVRSSVNDALLPINSKSQPA